MTFNKLTFIRPESSENHGFSENFTGGRSYLMRSNLFNVRNEILGRSLISSIFSVTVF